MVYDVRIKTWEEITNKYTARFERIRKYIDDRNLLEEVLLMLSQIKGTCASLRVLKEEGVPIPNNRLEKLAAVEAEWHAKAMALDVDDLETNVLYMTPFRLSLSQDVAAEVPAGVNQHGTNDRRVSPNDSAELKDMLNVKA